jgi:thiamine biosynthesis lipoprotein
MGSACRIVTPDAELTYRGTAIVGELEQRWSRFRHDSEVSELNRRAGRLCVVSPLTFELLARAEQARTATSGAFNPLLLDQLVAHGYDRTWAEVDDDDATAIGATQPGSHQPIELFADVNGVRLPEGTRFDPGGIGKGLAGDLVAAALLAEGARAVQIELGGDVRVAGTPWTGDRWRVTVDDSDHGVDEAAVVTLDAGGVATSSVARRRWRRGGVQVHHLIDAATGRPAATDLDAVTAIAPELWWAEVVAKVALMAGSSRAHSVFQRYDLAGILVPSTAPGTYDVVDRVERAA